MMEDCYDLLGDQRALVWSSECHLHGEVCQVWLLLQTSFNSMVDLLLMDFKVDATFLIILYA